MFLVSEQVLAKKNMVEIENEASILSMFDTILSERYVTDLFACLRHIALQFQYHLVTQQVVFD